MMGKFQFILVWGGGGGGERGVKNQNHKNKKMFFSTYFGQI